MLQTIKNELKILFSNKRLNRQRYIAYHGIKLLFILASLLPLIFIVESSRNTYLLIPFASVIATSFIFMMWWVCRRMNDVGISAKWYFFTVLFSASLFVFYCIFHQILASSPAASCFILPGFLSLISMPVLIYSMMILPGTNDVNRFGAVPPVNNGFTKIFSYGFIFINVALFVLYVPTQAVRGLFY